MSCPHRQKCNYCNKISEFTHSEFEKYRMSQTLKQFGYILVFLIICMGIIEILAWTSAPIVSRITIPGWKIFILVILIVIIRQKFIQKLVPLPKMNEIMIPCRNCGSLNLELITESEIPEPGEHPMNESNYNEGADNKKVINQMEPQTGTQKAIFKEADYIPFLIGIFFLPIFVLFVSGRVSFDAVIPVLVHSTIFSIPLRRNGTISWLRAIPALIILFFGVILDSIMIIGSGLIGVVLGRIFNK